MEERKDTNSEDIFKHAQGFIDDINEADLSLRQGRVRSVQGNMIEAYAKGYPVGSACQLINPADGSSVRGEVVGFEDDIIQVMLIDKADMVGPSHRVAISSSQSVVRVGENLIGRVINSVGEPIDGKGELNLGETYPLYNQSLNPMERRRITEPLDVGVRAINGLLTCGKGQRVGIMSGSGVGKSVLLGMMARYTSADLVVVALIGERGREVREFIEVNLGEEGLQRSIVVVAPSDAPPLARVRASFYATSIAEYFRDQGLDVLLTMDSITRMAMAQREIGLAAGQPPTTKGYPPSVFSMLPLLLERAGMSSNQGSITGFYTVLIEADDENDPIGDAVRSIVDGHIVLNRDLASKGQYPAIDALPSISRVMNDIVSKQHQKDAQRFMQALSTYREAADLINIGAYAKGSNPDIDYALSKIKAIDEYIKQPYDTGASLLSAQAMLQKMFADIQD